MKMSRFNLTALILASFFFGVQPAPARPLNERSKELTWQAWLLVDDQNQSKQYDPEGVTRRRITPKSVFIAPTFSPDSLPACADGYASDAMGRCVKLIQLDENAHLIYLLDRLRQQYGNFTDDDYYDDMDEEKPTPGPIQFNIPLDEVVDGDVGQEANVAIVVAPTNGNFNLSNSNDSFKINNVKRDHNGTDVNVPIIITRINIDDSEPTTPQVDVGTEEVPTTTEAETETADTTTLLPEPQAIFFKIPENVTVTAHEPAVAETKPVENLVRFPEVKLPDTNQQTQQMPLNNHQSLLNHQLPPHPDSSSKFRDETEQLISQLLPVANVKTTEKLFDDFIHTTDTVDNRRPYRHPNPEQLQNQQQQNQQQQTEQVFNHRNRDKWPFPPSWRDGPPQKPLVLRFNHLPAGKQEGHFYQHPGRQEGVYRKVPPQDLSYIFGFKDAHR